MPEWNGPERQFQGTGDRDVDITFLGLPSTATNAIDLKQVLKCDFIQGDNTCFIDFVNSTNLLLKVKADPGVVWDLEVKGRDHQGMGLV